MMRLACPLWLIAAAALPVCGGTRETGALRQRVSFNDGWLFAQRDPADVGDALAYAKLRPWLMATGVELRQHEMVKPARPEGNPGGGVSYAQPGFDDGGWRQLDLPHDWGIEGPFAQELPGETGKLPWQGVGWYRKHFTLPATDEGKHIYLELDGAMSNPAIWLNGRFVGGWVYGYTSFRVDLTPFLNRSGENVLAIRLDNPPDSSRWYPGSGLYRNVWLHKVPPVRVALWGGVFVTTPAVTDDEALVHVAVELDNTTAAKAVLTLTTRVFVADAGGRAIGDPVAISEPVTVEIDPAKARSAARANVLRVASPRRWDIEHPDRYVAVTTVESGGRAVDEVETPFGIRTIEATVDRGFRLNGRRVPLQGVCLHHDLGPLGAAVHPRAIERQLEILRAMGCNAIRTSHNPPAPELLELCDRMGFLVMDEAFDCWRRGKKWPEGMSPDDANVRYFDYARVFDDWFERDLRAMIRRDRNHPSVVMWSIGNEVMEQWVADGWPIAVTLAGIVREEDRTRPITSGFNNEEAGDIGFERAVDAVGFNYKPWAYPGFRARRPAVPVLGSETASTVSSRGEYFFPVVEDKLQGRADFQVSSYDLYAPPWALPPDVEWKALDENPFVWGEFVWTGFDYLGEPTPYGSDSTILLNFSDPAARARAEEELTRLGRIGVPSRSSYFGIVDLAGFPKDRFFLYQARWRPDLPMAHILPHWSWPERVGQVTPVFVYASGDEAELFLNGRSLGRKKRGPLEYRFRWDDVRYEPGVLRVETWRAGAPWAEAEQHTTGPAARIALEADRAELQADGRDLAFVTVRIADGDGRLVPRAKNLVRFSISGPGAIAGVDNGDATSFEPFQASERRAFNGLALVIVRTRRGESGPITLRAESDGLAPAAVTLVVR